MVDIKINATFSLLGRGKELCISDTKQENKVHYVQPKVFQNLKLSRESYLYFISKESKPRSVSNKEWSMMSKRLKIQAHLLEIAKTLGGKLENFSILDD